MKRWIFLFIVTSLGWTVQASERYEFYNGIRALGMGGAGVAVVNDETALLVNPAGLGKLRDYFITLFDPEADISTDTQPIIGTDIMKVTDPQFVLDKCNLKPDRHLHSRGQVFPSIVVPNFGIGIFGKNEVNAQVDSATNLFTYDYTNAYALVAGFNFRLFNGIIKLGVTGRAVNRTEVRRDDIDPTSTGLSLKTLASSGLGVAADGGIMISAPVAWLPTLAAVYRDIGRTSYGLRDGMFLTTANHPTSTPETVDGALSISPILGKRFRSTWTVEYRDALNVYEETDPMRRVHGGVEFNYADAFFIRGGMNQRYWTAGLELAIVNYQFQVASYGEDIGDSDTHIPERRYVVKFAFRF